MRPFRAEKNARKARGAGTGDGAVTSLMYLTARPALAACKCRYNLT